MAREQGRGFRNETTLRFRDETSVTYCYIKK